MDTFGCTPLHHAIEHDHLEIVTLLIDSHADIDPVKYVWLYNSMTTHNGVVYIK